MTDQDSQTPPKGWEMGHADCTLRIHSTRTSDIRVCTKKHADVTDRGRLPCTHYESIVHKLMENKEQQDRRFLVTLNVTGTATMRITAKNQDEAQDVAIERIENSFDVRATSYNLDYKVEEVTEVKE